MAEDLLRWQHRTPVRRPGDFIPKGMIEELFRLARIEEELYRLKVDPIEGGSYFRMQWKQTRTVNSWLFGLSQGVSDIAHLVGLINWVKEGPKIVDVTEQQYQAMSNVQVRVDLEDYHQPFPTVLVNLPPGHLHHACMLSEIRNTDGGRALTFCLISNNDEDNIATFIVPGKEMDLSLNRFDEDCVAVADRSVPNLRVAVNMMLAMTNLGCHTSYLFPAEVEQERKYIGKGNRPDRTGQRPSERLAQQPMVIALDRNVVLFKTEGGTGDHSEGTGGEKTFHWRRGHWHTVLHGKGKVQRKLMFYPPTMVRADLLQVGPEETTTTYTTREVK